MRKERVILSEATWVEIVEEYRGGATCREIGERHDVARSTVRAGLERLGVERRGPGRTRGDGTPAVPVIEQLAPTLTVFDLAERCLADTASIGPADAARRWLPLVPRPQSAAFVVALLTIASEDVSDRMTRDQASRLRGAIARACREVEEVAVDDMTARRAHMHYVSGDRSPWATLGERVYQRRHKRAARSAAKA